MSIIFAVWDEPGAKARVVEELAKPAIEIRA